MLSSSLRKDVKDFFGCTVADQYGCQEVNSIAFECPCGNMHCNTSVVKTEVVENGQPVYETEGDVVITSLCNKATPFIRYNLGDRAILHKNNGCAYRTKTDPNNIDDWDSLNQDGCRYLVDYKICKNVFEILKYYYDNSTVSTGAIKFFYK